MSMKLVKKTDDYSIYQRRDERYAVKDANKNAVNGEEKVKILVAEGLVEVKVAQPVAEEPAEEAAAEEASAEAPAEEEASEE
ncbi:hypothetical protein E4634_00795 [Mangrovimicrobium sediminis]|uniref:Uncharacterized protein n=1 Tax=Mangrovimicrobium sediminis TaxID=2562682 RepID=A0A4Z0M9C6_9GAMM|nr:hypothetical protein [Haliea sp. SAOS-164]TGD76119.1 hypothetical protein E4634_00795 [Haliea sp. SAOS-164]